MIDAVEQEHVVFEAGPAMLVRWPEYGAAVADLGIRAVIAMPVRLPTVNLGALCGFASRPELYAGVTASADRVADALAHAVLQAAQLPERSHTTAPHLPLFDEADYCEVVHQAVGMVGGAVCLRPPRRDGAPPGPGLRRRPPDGCDRRADRSRTLRLS